MPADCQLRSMGNCYETVEYPRFKAVVDLVPKRSRFRERSLSFSFHKMHAFIFVALSLIIVRSTVCQQAYVTLADCAEEQHQLCTYLCVGVAEIDDAKTAATARTIAKETCMNIMCEDAILSDQIVLKIAGRRAAFMC
ncbi:hypothetical protein CY34DRAFT_310790 [Suillus luteus UH-Slu-Lm8-n1]|uniref:Uncharacterized protein n=1 Tax=Suillus luteus UH-Slu-Lm8-n1 TaxID=930992 RepID=A0A0D0B5C5_9AGAM|nr:hypothetical protein CY34DRAFT_310790 [Suillus luteus UH-Slu-Lm8-n1]